MCISSKRREVERKNSNKIFCMYTLESKTKKKMGKITTKTIKVKIAIMQLYIKFLATLRKCKSSERYMK